MSSATPGDLRGQHAEVVAGDDVRATGARVRLDRLAVREHQDHEQRDDPERQREQRPERERARPTDQQDGEHLLGGVGHRGERVAGEHRERGAVAEPLVDLLIGADLATEQHVDEVGPTRARATRPLPELLLRLAAVMRAQVGRRRRGPRSGGRRGL